MSRPVKCRRICFVPGVIYFKPAGIPLRQLEENRLSLEEVEAIRLRDIEGLEQAECARRMNISRPTYQRVLAAARKKIADSLICGKALRLEGGKYELDLVHCGCARKETARLEIGGKGGSMKIAFATEDGATISQHFGRAAQYVVVETDGKQITGKEVRPKAGHADFQEAGHGHDHGCGCGAHGYGDDSGRKHGAMAQSIRDCKVVLAGGMGMGAYESLKSYGIQPVITDIENIDEAVKLYLEGKLPNLMERLH